MKRVGTISKIPVYESPNVNSIDGWCIVQTVGKPGDKDEQFYVVDAMGNTTRYAVPEVLMLAEWYRARENERAMHAATQTTEITERGGNT